MEEDLDFAESTVSSVREVSLNDAEKNAMRQFCLQNLQLKKMQENSKEERGVFTKVVKDKRASLLKWLKEHQGKCYTLPKSMYRDAEAELSKEGLASVPPYLRLQKNTADSSITPTVAELSIMDVTKERVAERKENPMQALINTIVDGARMNIRSTKESISLSDKLERGVKPIELDEVPDDIAEEMILMHKAAQVSKKKSGEARNLTSDTSGIIKTLQPQVAQVLEKVGRTSQQVQLDGVKGIHRIVKKSSSRAPKITLKIYEETVAKILDDQKLNSETLDALMISFILKRKEIVKRVQLAITKLPKSTSTSIKLLSLKEKEDGSSSESD